MDSLTQIVLGAACGELALGKKIGNRAMLFGAIGGTIPDLDVFVGPLIYSNEIDNMAFHRGFSHSFVFAILMAFILGFCFFNIYNSGKRKGTTTQNNWIWLFFLSIFTHPILDSFTSYGTQLFLPFSDYRVAFNTISVVDFIYTFPFLICLIIALLFRRISLKRKRWVIAGLLISSIYLVFTVINKFYVDSVFRKSLEAKEIQFQRFTTQPTIFNNLLWYGIAETKASYHLAFYSIFDNGKVIQDFIKLPKERQNFNLENEDLKKLAWFSNGYFNIKNETLTNNLIYNDLRYAFTENDKEIEFVFSFYLFKESGRWNAKQKNDSRPPSWDEVKKGLTVIWNRIFRDYN